MPLSNDLISQFVKATRDEPQTKSESTHYGKIVIYNNEEYVQLDGSDVLTPITSTTMVEDGQRVVVTIKDHSAVVTGNISSPSASKGAVEKVETKIDDAVDQITEFEIVIADRVVATEADIENLIADNARIEGILEADQAIIEELEADNVVINGLLTAANADIDNLKANKLDVSVADIKYATISSLDATNADIHNLEVTYGEFVDLTTKDLTAINATIKNLDTEYANIDFANINIAAVEKLFADSGIIEDLVVSEGKITGELVGVTIKGDLIEGETIVAEKLVVRGEDGLYYKLNLDGNSVEGEQTDYNSLNGKIIAAKSITASKIAVDDLVAFDATIGGFQIDDDAIHSTIKDNINSPMSGVYMDREGQFAVGDDESHLKYYKDDDKWKLEIAAQSIKMSSSKTIEETIKEDIENALKDAKESGEFDGKDGENATLLRIESSRGTVFKNDAVSTVLSVVLYHGGQRIDNHETMKSVFGSGAYLQWYWQRLDDDKYGMISSSDSRFGNNGFTFTLSPEDVDTKVTFMCELIT